MGERVFRRLDSWCLLVYSAKVLTTLYVLQKKIACNDMGQKIKQSEIFAAQQCSLIATLGTAVGKGYLLNSWKLEKPYLFLQPFIYDPSTNLGTTDSGPFKFQLLFSVSSLT